MREKGNPEHRDPSIEVSRRRFLTGVGLSTAGAVALGSNVALATEAQAATRADRFGRMFPHLPPFIPTDDRRRAALIDMGKPGGIMDAKDPLNEGPIRLITNPELSPNNRDNPTRT